MSKGELVERNEPESLVQAKVGNFLIPGAMADALLKQGVAPSTITAPSVVFHSKIAWEDLCTLATRDRKTLVSPVIVVTLVDAQPDAKQEFDAYKGMVRFEFTTEFGATHFLTHAMTYADTGELTPLWAWLKQQEPPFLARLAYVETRNSERHVMRPAPVEIEIV